MLTFSLIACDYTQRAEGLVLEKTTNRPLADVKIKKGFKPTANFLIPAYTDTLGYFNVHYPVLGLFIIPDLKLTFSKGGFLDRKVTLNGRTKNDTIYMERLPTKLTL